MFQRYLVVFVLLWTVLLAGCETTDPATRKAERQRREQEDSQLRAAYLSRIHEAELRVWTTLEPLMLAAADYQEKEKAGYLGAVFVTEQFYSEALDDAVAAEGLGPHVTTLIVFPDSPAALAGLRSGDRILSVNGDNVPRGQGATRFAIQRLKRILKLDAQNAFEVQRGEEVLTIEIEAHPAVYYPVIVLVGSTTDLFTDGDLIWMNLRLIESIQGANQLSYICAYALAKNVMRQSRKQGQNEFLGQMVDIAAAIGGIPTGGIFGGMGSRAHEDAFEIESDLIALYLLAAAGLDISAYPDFWEQVLVRNARKGKLRKNEEARLEAMRMVIDTIELKREEGRPIYPEEYLSGDASEIE